MGHTWSSLISLLSPLFHFKHYDIGVPSSANGHLSICCRHCLVSRLQFANCLQKLFTFYVIIDKVGFRSSLWISDLLISCSFLIFCILFN